MRWPWTSVARLDDAMRAMSALRAEHEASRDALRAAYADEIAHLRSQVDRLTDHLTRIQRREAGMTETPRAPRPALEPMPRELHEYIAGIANGSLQKEIRDRCYRRHAKGEPWASIVQEIVQPTEEP